MKINYKKILQVLLFLSVGLILLYIVYRVNDANYQEQCLLEGIPASECDLLKKVAVDFQGVRWFWMLGVFACFIISNLSRAIRWRILIEPLGKKVSLFNLFFSIMLSYFANLGFPRIGEFVRAGVIAKYEDLPADKVMGTVVLDRLADLIIFIALVVIVTFFQRDHIFGFLESQGFTFDGLGLVKQLGLLLILGVIGLWVLRYIIRLKTENPILSKIKSLILGFYEGIKSIGKIKRVGWFVFHSLMIWVMFFMMTYIGFRTFVPTADLTVEAGLTVCLFGALGFIIPSPGGMGTYHFFIIEALKLYGVVPADGFSFANILFFSIQIGCNITFGLLALIVLPLFNKVNDGTNTNK